MHPRSTRTAGRAGAKVSAPASIPLLEEQLEVRKRETETGRVRLHKRISERVQECDIPLLSEDVEIERVRVDRVVDAPEAPRQEGDVTIVPLHAEVVTTQWVVTEELHIRRRRSIVHERRQATLRREHIDVTRVDVTREASGPDSETSGSHAGERRVRPGRTQSGETPIHGASARHGPKVEGN
jgi:uncharacterized protein (TIGR02271 family)